MCSSSVHKFLLRATSLVAQRVLPARGRWFIIVLLVMLPLSFADAAPLVNCSNAPVSGIISHNLNSSYCELCGIGTVTIRVENPYNVDINNIAVTEDLGSSGLTYVPGSTTYTVSTGGGGTGGNPNVSGTNGSVLRWTPADIPALGTLQASQNSNNLTTLTITFQVRRASSLSDEGLVTANRNIDASMRYSLNSCPTNRGPFTDSTGQNLLPLREPIPRLSKRGRNVDASQGSGSYSTTVYGNINDDVIWRVQISNSGLAALQDLKFNDLMQNGNFQIKYACPTESAASAVANNNGVAPGGSNCISAGNTINNFVVSDPFGNPGNDQPTSFIDVPAGGSAYVYLVGKITSSCVTNKTNTASNAEWGCHSDPPVGGISATSTGQTAGTATATLSSLSVKSGLVVRRRLTGTNTSEPVGSKGTMTITIINRTGGSIKNIKLKDILPTEYVMDPTFTPTINMRPAYGNYDGMVDTVTWTNPAPTSTNPADPLSNTSPEFSLTSSTVHPVYSDQVNMLRDNDRVVIRFRVVMIKPSYFDNNANVDVRQENTGDGTDPANSTTLNNKLYVDYEDFCNTGVVQHASTYPYSDNFPSNPEDLDVDITGNQLVFILTNDPTQVLPLQVTVTNNGGHDAADYHTYVSFGATMDVVSAPGSCAVTSNPPALAYWDQPAAIPSDATVYDCTGPPIGPGASVALNFGVIKSTNPADLAADDLTFRADVVGEITLSDGTPLWFPTPDTSVINNKENNYSLDAIRARVLGYNLTKQQQGTCSEENPPPSLPDTQVEIGEECTYRIRTGGWFGFKTPGFVYIAVQKIDVVDQLPSGQAYISSTDPTLTSDPTIQGISLNPAPLTPLHQGNFDWSFNQVVPGQRITQKDQWFQADTTERILNDPVNTRAAPNVHAAISSNILVSTFQAVFDDPLTGTEQIYDLGPNTVGYPTEAVRRVDLTITEPKLLMDKKVCNETLYGKGPGCSKFVDTTNEGDTYDSYIYKVTITNEASASGVTRAPAYDVISTDTLDPSDLMYVVPFDSDGLDNDGDGYIDGADTDGEGTITDDVVNNGVPAQIINDPSNSKALLRIAPGASVTFYYRVDPDPRIAPLQTLTNKVHTFYDSLEGAHGHETVTFKPTGTLGGARSYASADAQAQVQIIPLVTEPKIITALSNTPMSGGPNQAVSVGEEIQYELRAQLPVATLRNFQIQDTLPSGMSCSEAPDVNLDAAPYTAAKFSPGGTFKPTCSNGSVTWNFGTQTLTATSTAGTRFPFPVSFIARVNNTSGNRDGQVLSNGQPATSATLTYINDSGNTVTLNYGQIDVTVREPRISLSESLEVHTTDAGDILTVTVTAQNVGNADAYNLRVMDDLATATNLTFLGNVSGTDPPDIVDTTTLGSDKPIFGWNASNPRYAIAPGQTRTFTYEVKVNTSIQPLQSITNPIQASWTSLPGKTTALNSSGVIGDDGTPTGQRDGALPNAGDLVNNYETTASDTFSVPPVVLSKTDLSTSLAPAIGAYKQYQIKLVFPEGTTRGVVVKDNLASTGVSYVLANNSTHDISYSFSGIATINGQTPSEAAFNSFPADGATGTVTWDVGELVTRTEDDTAGTPGITPTITITYYARVNNDLATNSGDQLGNAATANYINGSTGGTEVLNASTAPVTVVEPVLTLTKSVSSTNPQVTGGDTLTYQVTIRNTGTSTAYDINVVDTLPATLELSTGFTPTATIDGASVAGFVPAPAGAPGGPLIWGRGNNDGSLDLPVGSTLVITYEVLIKSAQPNDTLTNQVYADWTSLDGPSPDERTGTGCPTTTAPNDYCTGPASTTTVTADTTTLAKSIKSDSYQAGTLSTSTDGVVRVGDTLTYELDLNLDEGVIRNIQVQDVLPAGLEFAGVVSINGDTSASYTSPASGPGSNFSYAPIPSSAVPSAGQTGTLTWNIGTVTNDPNGDPTTDTLVIVYQARVITDTLAHTAELSLANTATLSYLDGTGATVVDPARLQSSASATVRQPIMGSLTKIDRSGRVSGSMVNAGFDKSQFRISACNTTGLAPAYSVQITDNLAPEFDQTTITGPVNGAGQPDVYVGGTLLNQGAGDYTYTPPAGSGGTMQFVLATPVDPGQCVNIDYDIGYVVTTPSGVVWDNTATLDKYYSLPAQSGQLYGPIGPVKYTLTTATPQSPPTKTLVSPTGGEVTIGDEVVYRITVPGTPSTVDIYNVAVTDTLSSALTYVSASEVSGNGLSMTDNTTLPDNVNLVIAHIPAGQQAVIELHARVDNNTSANAGVTFNNTASYSYPLSPGGSSIYGGSSTTPSSLLITEPAANASETVVNVTNPGNPPAAGDILRYTLTYNALGGAVGDNYSNAFDLGITDTLSQGLAFTGTATVSGAGNTIGAPQIAGDGVTTPESLTWGPSQGNATINVPEGTGITIVYEAQVLNSVLAGQALSNSAVIRWTGQSGTNAYERNGTGTPPVNDYFTAPLTSTLTTPVTNSMTKTKTTDTWVAADPNVRVGDLVEFELRMHIQEGTSPNTVITDTLPRGLAFANVVSINGDTSAPYSAVAPFSYNDLGAPTVAGDPATGPTTVTWNVGNLVNASDGNPSNDDFVIVYRAKLIDQPLPQVATQTLTNNAVLSYDAASGNVSVSSNVNLTLNQPVLNLTKTAAAAGGDSVLVAGEMVTYTLDVTNSGSSPAYDALITDTIPLGLRNGAATVTMVSMRLVGSGTNLTPIAPSYNAGTGVATWNLDTGTANAYSIPAGETLEIVYQVQADPGLGAGLTMTNSAVASHYYSFDNDNVPFLGVAGVRQDYGPTQPATTTLTTAGPDALAKQNPATTTAAVGDQFTYRITVPATPAATALYDVKILDDLSASAADLAFVNATVVSGPSGLNIQNTGTSTNLVLEDTNTGIDLAPGQQLVLDVTVQVQDTPTNVSGLKFHNTASYTYDSLNGNTATMHNGAPATTPDMTIVGPDSVTLQKSGPTQLDAGVVGNFTLNVQNTGTGTAWDMTVVDKLPNPTPGGMCDAAPTNVTARVFQADGTTPVSPVLQQGTDYTATFAGAPNCTLTLTMESAAAAVGAGDRLIITYGAKLDTDNAYATQLTNIAGATQWFSADTAGNGATAGQRTYTRQLTDGTPGTLDFQDAHTLLTESPNLAFREVVSDVTTQKDPAATATPGDQLHYRVTIQNLGGLPVSGFTLYNVLDSLNSATDFAAGSLKITSVPAGADVSNTNANGGARQSGVLDIRNLNLDPAGGANDSLVVEFDVKLAPVITNQTVVLNQSQMMVNNIVLAVSDDPNVNGPDNPAVSGDEDPTQIAITSAPLLQVYKTSEDITGAPTTLMAGDHLLYTLTIKNVGTEDAVNVVLQDQIPANTTYVGGSTTLNGKAVADPSTGVSALQNGLDLNPPNGTTPGLMPADATSTTTNVATVKFEVATSPDVVNGTVISNQGFVAAKGENSPVLPQTPSDDPNTPVLNDPTRNVVGNLPFLDSQKTVAIQQDGGTQGIVDPGDTLRYTITVWNFGATPATGVTLTDAVPANTTYVPGSVTLNGQPAGSNGPTSPLVAGLLINSPNASASGTINGNQSATITFDVTVDAGTAPGTVISNQGTVSSSELPDELTDADGIDSNGDQPTEIVVGSVQQLSITKAVTVVGGGSATAGGDLEYDIQVTNTGSLPATDVVITDNLNPTATTQLVYVTGSATLQGATGGVSFSGSTLTADYSSQYGDLAPGASAVLRFRATIDSSLAIGTTVTNTGQVTWNAGNQNASASVSLDVGGTPGVALLSGQVWHDSDFDGAVTSGEQLFSGWSVEIYRNNTLLDTVTTDSSGNYRINGLTPNNTGTDRYRLKFVAPGSTSTTAALGIADSPFTNGPQAITDIVVGSGSVSQGLNLPVRPDGIVYDSLQRKPIAGATLTLLDSGGQPLPSSCFADPVQQNQVTIGSGFYRFDINFSQGACASGQDYLIQVTPPPSGYDNNISRIIPPRSDASTPAFPVPTCPGTASDAIPATSTICEAVDLATVPPASVAPQTAGTVYYLNVTLASDSIPGHSQLFNNHIPLDPTLNDVVALSKTSAKVNVSRSDLIPYTITMNNGYVLTLDSLTLIDAFPPGFKYVKGSARYDGAPLEPSAQGNELRWNNLQLDSNTKHQLQLLFIAGAGVSEGKYTNHASIVSAVTGNAVSNEASATVRVVPDPTLDCSDVIGKVFDDENANGIQDEGEPGLPGVRLVDVRGLAVTTDKYGRYHITCAATPDETRGSNYIVKLDDRSLPTGYRLTTENPRVEKLTRGKMVRFNFGASTRRVVSLDVADGVFERGKTTMRRQWLPRLNILVSELRKKPSILRLSYLADTESKALVNARLSVLKRAVAKKWHSLDCCYQLTIETEVFWRKGGPP